MKPLLEMKTNQVPEVWSECFSQLSEKAASYGSLNVGKICSMESQALCQERYVQWKVKLFVRKNMFNGKLIVEKAQTRPSHSP